VCHQEHPQTLGQLATGTPAKMIADSLQLDSSSAGLGQELGGSHIFPLAQGFVG
jgi:hypothetical protein